MKLALSNVCKSFGKTNVLDDVSFDDDISTLAIIGPSGGGKSTLLRIIGGLIAPTSGTVSLDGHAVDYSEHKLPAYRAQLGFVFQNSGLFHHLSAIENIALPLKVVHGFSEEEARDRAMELLNRFGLSSQAEKRPAQMSGGQQQRVSIARAIAPKPKILLLDEPTSALDPEYTNEVLNLVNKLRETGTRFIIVTHEMGFARHACAKVAFLSNGSILEYGDSADVFSHPSTPQLANFVSKLLEWKI